METWEKLTNPEVLRENLISASVYISAYEMCREFIVSKPKDFFTDNWSMADEKISEEYFDDVMIFDKSPLRASLLWFKDQSAIDDQDIEKIDQARKHRNDIAHNMPMFISDPNHEVNGLIFSALLEVTHKIGVFWIVNYELGISSECDSQEIDEGSIKIGTVMLINMLRQIAFGQEPEEDYYHNEIKRRIASNK
ncbi:hypothetical protein [Balneatrix alpica]|uniref:hypothetical protein n=1 Tax=Balneatrix alpica TaxID=75684 RepID=UPI00273823B8|nr:hypothetical protein [Balneatrix alpica]